MTLWTQTDIEALELAIKKVSVLESVTFADQTFTYRDLDKMLNLLSVMRQSVAGGSRSRLAATRKGV